jgi:hypothetical protein
MSNIRKIKGVFQEGGGFQWGVRTGQIPDILERAHPEENKPGRRAWAFLLPLD